MTPRIYTLVATGLIAVVILALVAVVILQLAEVGTPDVVPYMATTALGSLASLLAGSRTSTTDQEGPH